MFVAPQAHLPPSPLWPLPGWVQSCRLHRSLLYFPPELLWQMLYHPSHWKDEETEIRGAYVIRPQLHSCSLKTPRPIHFSLPPCLQGTVGRNLSQRIRKCGPEDRFSHFQVLRDPGVAHGTVLLLTSRRRALPVLSYRVLLFIMVV